MRGWEDNVEGDLVDVLTPSDAGDGKAFAMQKKIILGAVAACKNISSVNKQIRKFDMKKTKMSCNITNSKDVIGANMCESKMRMSL